jgi:hypothetical protein
MNVLRFALLCLIALLLVSVVVGVFTPRTGAVEKVLLAVLGIALVYASSFVRRLGATPHAS